MYIYHSCWNKEIVMNWKFRHFLTEVWNYAMILLPWPVLIKAYLMYSYLCNPLCKEYTAVSYLSLIFWPYFALVLSSLSRCSLINLHVFFYAPIAAMRGMSLAFYLQAVFMVTASAQTFLPRLYDPEAISSGSCPPSDSSKTRLEDSFFPLFQIALNMRECSYNPSQVILMAELGVARDV